MLNQVTISNRTLAQKLSTNLLPGVEFFGIVLGNRGEPIRLIGPFKVTDRDEGQITFVDTSVTDDEPITVSIIDIAICFDKAIPIRSRHNGTVQEGESVVVSIRK